jgi:hypothetical protein
MRTYGAPVLKRPRTYDRGDYQLTISRRIIPGNAVRNPRRGSAVAAVATLMMSGLEIPEWMRQEAAAELLALAAGHDPLWWVRQ